MVCPLANHIWAYENFDQSHVVVLFAPFRFLVLDTSFLLAQDLPIQGTRLPLETQAFWIRSWPWSLSATTSPTLVGIPTL